MAKGNRETAPRGAVEAALVNIGCLGGFGPARAGGERAHANWRVACRGHHQRPSLQGQE